MTKSMLQIALLISVIATAVLGFTSDVQAECGGSGCVGLVNGLYLHRSAGPGGTVFVDTNGTANLTCTLDGGYLKLLPSNNLFAQQYDALLEALIFGKTVQIRTTESGPCEIIYVVIQRTAG
jgi:hypothetical protein